MTKKDRDALRAWLDLLTASNAIKKDIDGSLRREFGVSIARFDVLAALDRAGDKGLRAGDLTQSLLVTDGATTQLTAPLIRDGLIKREPCARDKRAAIFTLTRNGEKLFRDMAEVHRGWVARAFAEFSPVQLETLRDLLGKLDRPNTENHDGRTAA